MVLVVFVHLSYHLKGLKVAACIEVSFEGIDNPTSGLQCLPRCYARKWAVQQMTNAWDKFAMLS
jgi:hypothetical protein